MLDDYNESNFETTHSLRHQNKSSKGHLNLQHKSYLCTMYTAPNCFVTFLSEEYSSLTLKFWKIKQKQWIVLILKNIEIFFVMSLIFLNWAHPYVIKWMLFPRLSLPNKYKIPLLNFYHYDISSFDGRQLMRTIT